MFAGAQTASPFFEEWKTPFERIKDEHFPPAIKKGLEEQRRDGIV